MKLTAALAGACLLLVNATTALEWSFQKTAREVASRDNPFIGTDESFKSLVTATETDIRSLLGSKSLQQLVLPLPDGTTHTFNVRPSPVLSKKLAEQYPRIRSFEGSSTPNNGFPINAQRTSFKNEVISVVLSVADTPLGIELHAQYMSNKRGEMFLQPTKTQAGEGVVSFRVASRDTAVKNEPKGDEQYTCDTDDGIEQRRMLEESMINSHQVELENNRRKLQSANCNIESLGNFQCDPENNRAECNYDAGDCCGGFAERFAECTPGSDPSGCLCKDPEYLTVKPKTYRLAVAANVEFSALYNSNREAVMAQIVHTFTRVAGVFRREAGVGFEIVYAQIETEEATRTIGNSDTYGVAQQLPGVFDSAIGNDGYDIGHCLTTTPGGVAGGIGVTCNSFTKAMGVTGRGDVTGDIHFVDIVVHEMGHQMGSHHMFSGCGGNPGTPGFRVEPGSGTSFMSYASICGSDNVQDRMSPYFHTLSLESIRRYISNPIGGGACGYSNMNTTSIDRPRVDPHISLLNPTVRTCSIPRNTPFRLSAVDAPVNEGYFYSWEQVDNTEGQEANNLDDTPPSDGALFRSVPPKENDASRFFPEMSDYLSRVSNGGSDNYHERLPPTARELEFVLGVRKTYISREVIDTTSFYLTDYSANYVGDAIKVTVADVEPMTVTDVSLEFDQLTLQWTGGKLASKVRILGANPDEQEATFSIVVASSLENNGFAQVSLDRDLICANFPESQGRFVFAVESDEYMDGCSYLAVSNTVFVECYDVTAPPTTPPTSPDVERIDFEYGPEDGTFTENGKDSEVPYDNNMMYTYTITAQPGKAVLLEFVEFDVEEGWDFVYAYDGDSTAAPLIASDVTGTFGQGLQLKSSGEKLYIEFFTDEIINARGFVANYLSVDPSITLRPTVQPTAYPTEYVEYVSLSGNGTFNGTVNTATEFFFGGNFDLEIEFGSSFYNFYGYIDEFNGDGSGVGNSVSPGDTTRKLTATKGGYIRIKIEGFNEFPLDISFTHKATPTTMNDFGPVTYVQGPTREYQLSNVFADNNAEATYQRTVLVLQETTAVILQTGDFGICLLSKGNVGEPDYSYLNNVFGAIIPVNETSEVNVDRALNEFPYPLNVNLITDVYYYDDTSYVPITIGDHAETFSITCRWASSWSATIHVQPLLLNEPFVGDGIVTVENAETLGFMGSSFQYYAFTIEAESIGLQANKVPVGWVTYIFPGPLSDVFTGVGIAPLAYYESDPNTYPTDPVNLGGTSLYSFILVKPSDEGPLIPDFEFQYTSLSSSNGGANFTTPLPGDVVGDQLKTEGPLSISGPYFLQSGNKPVGTTEHALSERWQFVAPPGYKLKITFGVLDLEKSVDFIHVYDGLDVDNVIQTITGSYAPPSISSRSNEMTIRVVRDATDDRQYLGVQAVVDVVRDENSNPWYLYVIGAMGTVIVGSAALFVYKSRGSSKRMNQEGKDLDIVSGVEFVDEEKAPSNTADLQAGNPLFDPNDL